MFKGTAFRVPGFLRDNPLESFLAAALLVGLLFMAGDGATPAPLQGSSLSAAEKN